MCLPRQVPVAPHLLPIHHQQPPHHVDAVHVDARCLQHEAGLWDAQACARLGLGAALLLLALLVLLHSQGLCSPLVQHVAPIIHHPRS